MVKKIGKTKLLFVPLLAITAVLAFPAIAQQQYGPSPGGGAVKASTEQGAAPVAPTKVVVPTLPTGIVESIKPQVPKLGAGLSPEEFSNLINSRLPLSEAQTRQSIEINDKIKRASNSRPSVAPRPVSVSARVTLDAGANPHVLRLGSNTVTSIVFSDVTGSPWPVLRVVAGQKGVLDIPKLDVESKTNMFTISPLDEYINTNIAVFLEGAPAPVMMSVVSNQSNVDFRVDVSVQARGPGAVAPVISRGLSDSVPQELISMVSGVTPSQAKPLKVIFSDVGDVQAWVLGNKMFVRTKAIILTPAVPKDGRVAAGADGTKVYELPVSPEVRLMSEGNVGRLQLGGFPPPSFTGTSTSTAGFQR